MELQKLIQVLDAPVVQELCMRRLQEFNPIPVGLNQVFCL